MMALGFRGFMWDMIPEVRWAGSIDRNSTGGHR